MGYKYTYIYKARGRNIALIDLNWENQLNEIMMIILGLMAKLYLHIYVSIYYMCDFQIWNIGRD